MDPFLNTYHKAELNQENKENLKKPQAPNETEVTGSHWTKENPGPHGISTEFYQSFEE